MAGISIFPLLILGLIVCIGLFSHPMARAFMFGLASARDPMHRVTPVSPWTFFHRAFWRRLRVWAVIWIVGLTALFGFGFHKVNDIPFLYRILFAFQLTAILAWLPLAFAAADIALAPRCRSVWTLQAATLPLAIGFYVLLSAFFFWIDHVAGCGTIYVAAIEPISMAKMGKVYNINLTPIFTLAISILAFARSRRWARRKGERWFRFEQ